ncbi:hypothetical protein PHSY_007305 [Pseudozyma hubeiensis SY62]|uniref:Uncharacterized protein n=1 Tax=Pseudozyma hubeiensis (strain SY62) TaxID=1305764 RepID=R9PEL8_PSEHS|nr:hypothetical protein PHSY_007305 [Pseudozyma hubeiensis SY62]GAC99702.1 hypothetical protein PHSY_007305 [Pseudozyma hubeiensis SY62]
MRLPAFPSLTCRTVIAPWLASRTKLRVSLLVSGSWLRTWLRKKTHTYWLRRDRLRFLLSFDDCFSSRWRVCALSSSPRLTVPPSKGLALALRLFSQPQPDKQTTLR